MNIQSPILAFAPLVTVLFLSGCGGATPNIPPTARFTVSPNSGPAPLEVTLDASASNDIDGAIASYSWEFSTGRTASGRSVRHTFTRTGRHTIRLTVVDDDGATGDAVQELVVNARPIARILADPVDGEAPVSVTFDASESVDSDGKIVTFEWDVAGVAHSGDAAVEHTFEQPGIYAVRLTVTDDLDGVGEAVFELNVRDDAGVPFTVPYAASGAYSDAIRPCTYASATMNEFCAITRLPFLGAEFETPTVDDVMSRVLVSHRWMGDSLREALERLPADVRLLARSVTAIVIASDIRPSHYRPGTGAIYLDPRFLWETPEQRAVVSIESDFRSGFGSDLQVDLFWRMVRNNVRWGTAPESANVARAERLLPFVAFLLYHELSHASDFTSGSETFSLTSENTVLETIIDHIGNLASSRLARANPLRSDVMRALAGVSFLGESATPEQRALLPEDLIDEFSTDGAVDYYSYTNQFEDLAGLHEAVLMSYHHGYEKDVAIVGTDAESREQNVVAWGQRGRMTDPHAVDRVRWLIEEFYPGNRQELTGYLDGRPEPLSMRQGDTWEDNLVLEGGEEFNDEPLPASGPRDLTLHDAPKYPTLIGCIRVERDVPTALAERLRLQ